MRRLLLLLLVLMAIGPASAQVTTVSPRAVQQVQPQVIQRDSNAAKVDIAADPERARAEINRLRAKNRALRQQFANTLADLQSLRHDMDEMTRPGGSLVTAQCVDRITSRNTAGESEDCSASGYTCGKVSGLCHRSCTTSDMCSGGFVCDIEAARCVLPPISSGD